MSGVVADAGRVESRIEPIPQVSQGSLLGALLPANVFRRLPVPLLCPPVQPLIPLEPGDLLCRTVSEALPDSVYFRLKIIGAISDIRRPVVRGRILNQHCKRTCHDPVDGTTGVLETDGDSNALMMDVAKAPTLLSLPYPVFCDLRDTLSQHTRRFVLTDSNPYYFKGTAQGAGGPRAGLEKIWPLAIILRGRTSNDDHEIVKSPCWLRKPPPSRTSCMSPSLRTIPASSHDGSSTGPIPASES